ncbi:adhesin [Actinospica sp. MGRD01-02]|uniref:Adhesin n=1 Tax=Actinospica acidithermotolerans TaxID=2828514 RepID=A0A941EDF3_9ACTN|nr:adhesin [Actinospica acidithermotolerans]MBR7829386.1 adhesin [Actinospica acidithermotolerans]
MLTLTDAAATAINQLTSQPNMPETTGLRIAPSPDESQGAALAAALTSGPGPEDEVLEVHEARVYLEPEAAQQLSDKVLDAETAAGGQIAFHLRPQDAA